MKEIVSHFFRYLKLRYFIIFSLYFIDIILLPTIQLNKYADDLGTHKKYKNSKDDNINVAVDGVEKLANQNKMQITPKKLNTWLLINKRTRLTINPSSTSRHLNK